MDKSRLKKFAQYARRSLIEQVQSKLKLVLAEESEARRESPKAVVELEQKLAEKNEEQLIEQVAYLWFNRFCALRFMDVNQYNRIMVISPLAGQFQPEILAEAKAGHIDEGVVSESAREKVFGLLSGSVASRDGQSEAFRHLIVAVCNDLHSIMPYLFERIEDYTELLMPDDLLSGNSILAYTREAMTPEACESVESIGWLYQFYISEKKDKVFDDLKKNKKITPENIPAATQLFTPHWIVRYLVENSLGRLWILNNPSSKVIEQMDYYIKPVEVETDFLRIESPEEIKICDPACGSGHMLTYAYDLLYAIYLDAGYDSTEIPEKILTNNLYGIEIDERAAELAAFALTMKAVKGNPADDSNNRRRFFRNPVKPNICRLENVSFTGDELDSYIEFTGKDLFTQDLRATLKEFEEADNFGSLIQPTLKTPADALATLKAKDVTGQLFLTETHKSVLKVLNQTDYLSQKYHVVVANPPYMGAKSMTSTLKNWAGSHYPVSKFDLYAMFIDRNKYLVIDHGLIAMITMQSWMFLSSFEKLRDSLFEQTTLLNMAHLGPRAFDSIGGEVVATTAFVIKRYLDEEYRGMYLDLSLGRNEAEKNNILLSQEKTIQYYRSIGEFRRIPCSPVAYWVTDVAIECFSKGQSFSDVSLPKQGLSTCNNDLFLRYWHEVSYDRIGFGCNSRGAAAATEKKWFPYNKGGSFRKWYGNNDYLVNWELDGKDIHEYSDLPLDYNGAPVRGKDYYFLEGMTWSSLAGDFSGRYSPAGFAFDAKGPLLLATDESISIQTLMGCLNSKAAMVFLKILAPTLDFNQGPIGRMPLPLDVPYVDDCVTNLIEISKLDWDLSEMSWDFKRTPLLCVSGTKGLVSSGLEHASDREAKLVAQYSEYEQRNNQAFIEAYGLSGRVDPCVDPTKVPLFSSKVHSFGSNCENERTAAYDKSKLLDFISYAIGCMFGRYSLDKKGLILANQADTLEDYLNKVPSPSFLPDDDNVIPLIDFDGDWFEDDITERFKQFLKVTFGEEHFSENLAFIEEAIGKDIKKFFLKDFYTEHVKRYKRRPIYWMFSSPKGSFNALIYMHRYRPDTVSVVLNDYLREFRTKLQARKESYEQVEISASASAKEKNQAIKTIQKINEVLDEVNDYERDILYPLAGKAPEIDLDDGVKHNYPLFGKALKKVTGLS